MSQDTHAQSETMPPQAQLIQMAMAHQVSSLLRVAAQLKLADHLAEGPRTVEQLAQATKTHAPSLYRLMRTLSSMGLFAEVGEHQFSLTPMSEPLRSSVPGSVLTSVLTITGDLFTRSLGNLLYSVQTGKTAFEKEYGMPVFDWLGNHPEEASMFSDTMVGFHGAEPPAVAAAYDFSAFKTIADVGGATGNLLTTILGKYPGHRGLLFDLPHNAGDAAALLQARSMTDRVTFQPGSFFESIPSDADLYLMSHIIHDWSEDQCLTILANCRKAMGPNSRLLLIEMVLPSDNSPHPGKMLDIIMLTAPGGQERTEPEYRALLDKAGFKLTRVVPTASPVSIIEAVPA